MPSNQREKIAFVFAGGGSLGAVNVGMLKALLHHGVHADMVVGASVGSINAAYFAVNPMMVTLEALENIWIHLDRNDVFPLSLMSGIRGLMSGKNHLISPSSLEFLLEKHFANLNLEECKIPCHVIATDLLSGMEFRISTGRVVDALLASAAIPAIFPPRNILGHHLADGGIANNTPISAAVDFGATHVIVLPTGFSCALKKPPENLAAMALHGLNLVISRQLIEDFRRFSGQVRLTMLPPLCPMTVAPHDFSHARELIDRSYQSTTSWLKQDQAGKIPMSLAPHEHRMEL